MDLYQKPDGSWHLTRDQVEWLNGAMEREAVLKAEVERLRAAIKALVEAGNRLAEDEDPIDPALEAWAEAKRAALRGGE